MLFNPLPTNLVIELDAFAEPREIYDEHATTYLCCSPSVIYDYPTRKLLSRYEPPNGYTHAEAVATLLSLYENEFCSLYRLPSGAFYFCA